MSYDIHFVDPATKEVVQLDEPHDLKGGNYAVGGTTEAWLNVTWNYGKFYHEQFGEEGIRSLYGLTGEQAIPLLAKAIAALGTETDSDYWKPTPGNAGAALLNLLELAKAAPQAIIEGD